MLVPSPRISGEKSLPRTRSGVARQRRMRGRGRWAAVAMQQCARVTSSALPVKPESAPHPRLPPHLLPVATGRRDQHAFSRMCSLHSCDSASLPFAPRQRSQTLEKRIGMQRRKQELPHACPFSPLRGAKEGGRRRKIASYTLLIAHACPFSPLRRGEGAAAAADEGRFRASSATADEAALAHGCNVDRTPPPTAPHPVLPHHLLPAGAGRREGNRCRKNARLHSGDNACWSLLPVATGRRCPAGRMRGAFGLHQQDR